MDIATQAKRSGAVSDLVVPEISVVIPAYNEEKAVAATVDNVREVLDAAGITHEIIVVNDGSSDGTLAAARATDARVVNFPDNAGYGHALKAGIAVSRADLIAILDADGTYPASYLPEMIEMAAVNDMVVGDRGAAMENVPLIRKPAKWVLNNLASYMARRPISDLNSGLRVFRRATLEQFIPLLPDGFSFTTTITLCMLATGARVSYLPILYGKRVGQSKIRASHFFKFMWLVVRLTTYFQPLRVFGPLGLALFLLGTAKAIYDVYMDNLSETAVFGWLGALIIWSLGLLADMIAKLHFRQQFMPQRYEPPESL